MLWWLLSPTHPPHHISSHFDGITCNILERRRDAEGSAFNVCIFDNVHFYTNYFFIPFYFDRVRL